MENKIKKIAIVGTGTVVNGIGLVFSQRGFRVTLTDQTQQVPDARARRSEKNLINQQEKVARDFRNKPNQANKKSSRHFNSF
ncbi:3-hydroxyacyl-CoA dehydrogenase, NAD binding domain [Cyclobacterium lianum]|uniref:3-hydroxyacyl-CoA dehydrogenase, NAD binding domain n=1 Tax=Cyclobacterium lianum TaxID=388280 RepID=A0A1M7KZ38_9BACT|nr:3-hydroxyacyl-CoA dehydrogenase, NAD binding domain [Cyclobacterium lianum]